MSETLFPTTPERYYFNYSAETNKMLISLEFKIVDDLPASE